MTVVDFIAIRQTQNQNAHVVLYERSAIGQPAISHLGLGEVQPIALSGEEKFGCVWLKIA